MIALGSVFLSFLLGLGALVILQPEWVFTALRERSPAVLYNVDTDRLVLALTIDDGPDPDHTPRILDTLKQYGVKVTFFLIAERIKGNEALVERMIAEGHEIANHMVDDQPSIRLSTPEFEDQFLEADAVLRQFAQPRWFRPGSGWYDEPMLATVERHGYRTVLGSIYPYDPHVGSAWFAARYVLWKARPGAVIVLHDYGMRGERTAQALTEVLPTLLEQGYTFLTLSELINQTNSE
jgi:peptidoglycan/xylan/chitin deacetylase (PgdA/CDA1 family)